MGSFKLYHTTFFERSSQLQLHPVSYLRFARPVTGGLYYITCVLLYCKQLLNIAFLSSRMAPPLFPPLCPLRLVQRPNLLLLFVSLLMSPTAALPARTLVYTYTAYSDPSCNNAMTNGTMTWGAQFWEEDACYRRHRLSATNRNFPVVPDRLSFHSERILPNVLCPGSGATPNQIVSYPYSSNCQVNGTGAVQDQLPAIGTCYPMNFGGGQQVYEKGACQVLEAADPRLAVVYGTGEGTQLGAGQTDYTLADGTRVLQNKKAFSFR